MVWHHAPRVVLGEGRGRGKGWGLRALGRQRERRRSMRQRKSARLRLWGTCQAWGSNPLGGEGVRMGIATHIPVRSPRSCSRNSTNSAVSHKQRVHSHPDPPGWATHCLANPWGGLATLRPKGKLTKLTANVRKMDKNSVASALGLF